MKRQGRLGKKLLLAGGAGVASLLLAELAYRAHLGDWKLADVEPVVPRHLQCFDADLGWAMHPNLRAVSHRTGEPVEYVTNAHGMRDDAVTVEKLPGSYRIALLGDSRTLGFGVPIDAHYSKILEGYLRDVEVLNFGVIGYGVDQELLCLQKKALAFSPDLVVMYIAHFQDDRHMHRSRFGQPKPWFTLENGELVLHRGKLATMQPPTLSPWSDVTRWIRRYSRVANKARASLKSLRAGAKPRVQDTRSEPTPAEVEAFERDTFDLALAILAETQRVANEAGAGLLVVTEMPELARRCEADGIPALDVKPALDNRIFALPEDLYHIDHAGNGVLAWEIARHLREHVLPAFHCFKEPFRRQ